MNRIKGRFKKIINILKKPEMEILPGHLAFFLVLSIVPITTLFAVIASSFSISIDNVIDLIQDSLPREISNLIIPIIDGQGFDFNIGFFMIIGFIVASNGLYSVVVTVNTLYKAGKGSYLKRRLKSLIATLLLVSLLLFVVIVLAFGSSILIFISEFINNEMILNWVYYIYLLLKWPLGFIFIFTIILLIYMMTPDFDIKTKQVYKGAIFTTISWIVATGIYSIYINNFANYDLFYGSLSNIIAMMIWVYLLSFLFVMGIAMNALDYELEKSGVDNNH